MSARAPGSLEDPLPIAEAGPPLEVLIEVIKRLLAHRGYPVESFKILVKERNRGTVETLSVAT